MPKLIIGALIILLIAGVVVAKTPQLKAALLQKLPIVSSLQNQAQQIKIDPEVQKKQDLEKFYKQIAEDSDNHDWSKLYDFSPQSVRNKVSKENYVEFEISQAKKSKVVSEQTTVNSVEVTGDKGVVDRTRVTCLTKECTGDNRKEENAKKNYEYVNGKWQLPDPEPSERALKAANYGYLNSSKKDQADLMNWYGYGSDDSNFTIRNWAVWLDKNLEELVRVETLVDQDKSEKSAPATSKQSPSSRALQVAAAYFTNLSPSDQAKVLKDHNWTSASEAINHSALVMDNNPAELARIEALVSNFKAGSQQPVQQAPVFNNFSAHCTSQSVGSSTYTNCY